MTFLFRRIATFVLLATTACSAPLSTRPVGLDPATRGYLDQFLPFNNILSVDHFIPPIPGGREAILHFSQPMAALPEIGGTALRDLATIVPTTPGTFEWVHPKTLIFTAGEPFQNGVRYEIRVTPGFESLGGAVLVNGAAFEFTGKGAKTPELPLQFVAFRQGERDAISARSFRDNGVHFESFENLRFPPILGDARILAFMEEGVNAAREMDLASIGEISLPQGALAARNDALSDTDSAELYSRLERNARREFRVDLDAPDFVRVGDRFEVLAILTNSGAEDASTSVTWQSGGFSANCESGTAIDLPADGRVEISCPFFAEEATLTKSGSVWESRSDFMNAVPVGLAVSAGEVSDVETVSVAVRNERYAVETASGLADPDARVAFAKPPGALGDFGGLDLRIGNRGSREVTAAKVFLNGGRLILSSLDPLRPEDGVFIPMAKLPETMDLAVARQRGSVLSYRFALSYALPAPPGTVVENGVSVSRFAFDGVAGRVFGAFTEGREYEVRIAVYLEHDAADAVVHEALPAGVRVVATEKGMTVQEIPGGVEFSLGSVARGLKRVSYRVRAERRGGYFWPRALVFDRSAPRIFGTSGSSRIEIE